MALARSVERLYESLFICPSDTSQQTIDAFMEKVKSTLDQTKGTVRSVQVWGRRRLAYPIKHHKDGLYVYIDFNGGNNSVEALKNLYRVTDLILRHMTVERVEAEPAPVRKAPGAPEGTAQPAAEPVAGTVAATEAAPKTSPSAH